jgi:hypothetical protein
LFPPPTYELPSDVLFDVTVVLQFVAGLIAARVSVALWRGRRGAAALHARVAPIPGAGRQGGMT